ncbi:acyltransferase family protein [Methanocella sp. MCL-LM]|uniref:acyltransferase family protein n=1 Tax=Methanocella sp. MCL-LM TaxID=3412035 RepID=UPI003C754A23
MAEVIAEGQSIEQQPSRSRLYFIDNLRILLAVLVVMHHAGQPYGPGGGWWIPAEPASPLSTVVLGVFFMVNMSFFMGLFFLISAYFLPGSYERKGAGIFFKDRLTRLGIPLLIFSFLVFPVMLWLLHGIGTTSFGNYYFNTYLTLEGMLKGEGFTVWHLWFLEQLLIFSGIYVLWRKLRGDKPPAASQRKTPFPGNGTLALFAIGLGLAMFSARIIFPVNVWLPIVAFEPAHYPEYVALFIVGILAYRNDWFNALPVATARIWGYIIGLAMVALIPMFALFGANMISGGLTLGSLALSLWEAVMCVAICIVLVSVFRDRYNAQGKAVKAMADSSFTVYLIHIPVIVFLQYLLIGITIHPLLKFALVCLVGVPACFLLSHYVVRRLPLAKHIL